MRIWYQSFTDPVQTRDYHARLTEFLGAVAAPATRFDVVGMDPPSRMHRITELRCALEVVRNAIQAERAGYDAFVLGHFQDSGLWEARAAVQIPVVGMGEASLLHACTLGRKIGLVTIDPIHVPYHEDQIARYGLGSRVPAICAVRATPLDYLRAMKDPAAYQQLRQQYLHQFSALAERGIELVVLAGGLAGLLFANERDLHCAGTIALNPVPVVVKAAEVAVELRRLNGTAPSRASTFALPSEAAIEAVLAGRKEGV